MDWIVIIILGVGLPAIGGLIGISMVARKYAQIKENPHDFGLSSGEDVSENFGKFVIFLTQHMNGIIFGVLIIILFWDSTQDLNSNGEQLSTLGVALAIAVGCPAFFGNISRGLIMSKGFESLVKNPKNFGRVLVHGGVLDVPIIIGLLFAVLSLLYSGLLGYEYLMTQEQIDGLFNAALVFSILSSGILISGFMVNRMENPFEIPNFPKGIVKNSTGVILPIIGFIYYIIKFKEIGLF